MLPIAFKTYLFSAAVATAFPSPNDPMPSIFCLRQIQSVLGEGKTSIHIQDPHDPQGVFSIITTDSSICGKAESAVVTPSGKLIKITKNGGCELSESPYKNSAEFLDQMVDRSSDNLMIILRNTLGHAGNVYDACRNFSDPRFPNLKRILGNSGYIKTDAAKSRPSPEKGFIDVTQ